MEHTIHTKSGVFTYRLICKRIKHIYLRLQADGRFDLCVPYGTPQQQIETILHQKAMWMARALAQQEASQATYRPFTYQSGQTIYLQGEPYSFRCLEGDTANVWIQDRTLYARIPHGVHDGTIRKQVERWEKEQVQRIYERYHAAIWPSFAACGLQPPRIQWRVMRSRWGSCSKQKGRISLNVRLLRVPPACFIYVVMHEYCHLLQPNHGKAFYRELAKRLPRYQSDEKRLKEWTHVLNIS